MPRPRRCGAQQNEGARNERKPRRPVKTSERDRNQVAPMQDEDTDVRMELSGRDEVRQDEDASAEMEMMAHEAMDQEMRDGERKECEIVGHQENEAVQVMRSAREPS